MCESLEFLHFFPCLLCFSSSSLPNPSSPTSHPHASHTVGRSVLTPPFPTSSAFSSSRCCFCCFWPAAAAMMPLWGWKVHHSRLNLSGHGVSARLSSDLGNWDSCSRLPPDRQNKTAPRAFDCFLCFSSSHPLALAHSLAGPTSFADSHRSSEHFLLTESRWKGKQRWGFWNREGQGGANVAFGEWVPITPR